MEYNGIYCTLGSSDFDIFLEIQYASCVFGLALKSYVFWNIEQFLSYLTFYPLKKVGPPLIRVEKNCLQNWAYRVSKEAEFYADFKNVQKSCVWQKGGKNLQKNWIFRDLENFAKNRFSEKKSLGTSLTQEFYTFLKSA